MTSFERVPAPRSRHAANAALVALVAVAALLAALLGWSLPGVPSAGALPGPSPVAPGPPGLGAGDWARTLAALDAARSAAFATGDASRLDAVHVRGSPPHRADVALLARHARAGRRVTGLRHVVVSARPRAGGADAVELDVVDRLPPYALVDRSGRVVRRWPGRGEARWRVTLRRTASGWRVAAVATVAGGGPIG